MITLLLVTRQLGQGEVLLERMYGDRAERAALVADARRAAQAEWAGGAAGVHRVAVVGPNSLPAVYVHLADLTFCAVGGGDLDELVLSELLHALLELVARQCPKGLSEAEFAANHERIALQVDTVLRHGQLEHTDKDLVQALATGTPDKVTAAMLERPELLTVSCPAYSAPSTRTMTKTGKSNPTMPTAASGRDSPSLEPTFSRSSMERARANSAVFLQGSPVQGVAAPKSAKK